MPEIINIDNPTQKIVNVTVGEGVRIFHFVNLYGCSLGDGTKVGPFTEIQKGVSIGKNCKISSHSFICDGVTIEDEVFIGHGVMFINDMFPRSTNEDGSVKTESDWKLETTYIEKRAAIGTNATILAGVRIGAGALVGAGSVVTKDVPPMTKVAGNPARVIGKVGPDE
jgi:UDP-2-acetamido-3-amino-2,3-dideoxy-glucuronate N-acetyltransferase